MNSSLDTDWVGIGEGKADVSAGNNCFSSSELNKPIVTYFVEMIEYQIISSDWAPVQAPKQTQRNDRIKRPSPSQLGVRYGKRKRGVKEKTGEKQEKKEIGCESEFDDRGFGANCRD
jgi:hypothetical protein